VRGPSYPERRLAQARGFHRWIMVFRFVFRCPQLGISRDAASLANWVLARKNRSAVAPWMPHRTGLPVLDARCSDLAAAFQGAEGTAATLPGSCPRVRARPSANGAGSAPVSSARNLPATS
jgi:hypothetical protein